MTDGGGRIWALTSPNVGDVTIATAIDMVMPPVHNYVMDAGRLRTRQRALGREAVLATAAELLRRDELDHAPVRVVAEAAGVSVRTLYRYFPTRAALMQAAAERVVDMLLDDTAVADFEDIAPGYKRGARMAAADAPRLGRVLLNTDVGAQVKARARRTYVTEIANALEPLVGHLPPARARKAMAAVTGVATPQTWVWMMDEWGLTLEEATDAAAWAINAIVDALKAGAAPEAGG